MFHVNKNLGLRIFKFLVICGLLGMLFYEGIIRYQQESLVPADTRLKHLLASSIWLAGILVLGYIEFGVKKKAGKLLEKLK